MQCNEANRDSLFTLINRVYAYTMATENKNVREGRRRGEGEWRAICHTHTRAHVLQVVNNIIFYALRCDKAENNRNAA